jgi:hypothetical protein
MSRFFNIIWGIDVLDQEWTLRHAAGVWIFPKASSLLQQYLEQNEGDDGGNDDDQDPMLALLIVRICSTLQEVAPDFVGVTMSFCV